METAGGADGTLVVGAAIVRDGSVLAAERSYPADVAGRWEFPGGKVRRGEPPEAALVREIAEELSCVVTVDSWLAPVVAIDDRHALRVALCRPLSGDPVPTEHRSIRWLALDDLDHVDWLDPDVPFVDEVRVVLRSEGPSRRVPTGPVRQDLSGAPLQS